MHRLSVVLLAVACILLAACPSPSSGPDPAALQQEVGTFLQGYTDQLVALYKEASEAEWASNTRIIEGDDTNRKRTEQANEAMAAFTGSVETIETTRGFLENQDLLEPLQVRQLEGILYVAANSPQTVPELVKERIAQEALQNERLFGFDFQVDGASVSANDIDDLLETSDDEAERLAYWQASKEVGKELREGLIKMVQLRNQTVQALGYDNYFEYQVSEYDMTADEMMAMLDGFVNDLWPLYRELHTWARYELAEQYGAGEVPDLIPAHWLPNRWAQDWAEMVTVEGLDLNPVLAEKTPEWIIEQGEEFYVSLGFDRLPQSFWDKSSLYPAPADAEYRKNNHASAWHMNLADDVRCLMSVQANERWWGTTHHELGHIYYYMRYSQPEVPVLLRGGANRGFHEAIGTLLGMAATQKPFLVDRGLVPEGTETDEIQTLLKEALDSVVFIPFSVGTMSHFEYDLYAGGLEPEQYNQRWWEHVARYQGVAPPEPRGEDFCDACTKTHIINDPAQYYDYAFSYILLHQIHAHIADTILQQDPRNTNYFGRQDVGQFLDGILKLGATQPWRQVMQEQLGIEISAKAMLDYFQPLVAYLQEQNAGRTYTLPETL